MLSSSGDVSGGDTHGDVTAITAHTSKISPQPDSASPNMEEPYFDHDLPVSAGYRIRVNLAFGLWRMLAYPAKRTQADLAVAVGAIAGRTYSGNAATDWLSGSVPRTLPEMDALALGLGVPAGWLYFGHRGAGEMPGELAGSYAAAVTAELDALARQSAADSAADDSAKPSGEGSAMGHVKTPPKPRQRGAQVASGATPVPRKGKRRGHDSDEATADPTKAASGATGASRQRRTGSG